MSVRLRRALPGALALALLLLAGARPSRGRAVGPGLPAGVAIDPTLTLVARGGVDPWRLGMAGAAGGPVRALIVVARADDALAGAMARAGVEVRGRAGRVLSVEGPPAALLALAGLPGVTAIERGRTLRPLLDRSAAATGARTAHEELGVDGAGVLVGVVDTGVDFRHADFRRADGTSRIRWLLDMSAEPAGLHPELEEALGDQPGAVYEAADLDAVLAAEATQTMPARPVTESDPFGHGTHVAGIAAGNGRATGGGLDAGRYVGVAPGAELIVVKATRGDGDGFGDFDLVAGVRFVFERAAELGRPAVVNLSVGGQGGPHDGASALELALAGLLRDDAGRLVPGRAIVVAAGNDGFRDFHATGSLDGEEDEVAVDVPPVREGVAGELLVEVWYSGEGELELSAVTPDGDALGPVGAGASRALDTSAGTIQIVHEAGRASSGGLRAALVALSGREDRPLAPGAWRLRLHGHATRWDAWVAADALGGAEATLRGGLSGDTTLTVPGAAEELISVGAFATRNDWTTSDGLRFERGRPEVGRAALFSGTGPTREGGLKPDLVAPGEFIVAALASEADPRLPRSAFHVEGERQLLWADDGVHGVLRGTSQAAPHVAGAVALLLEVDPTLDAAALRELLRVSAATDGFTHGGRAWTPRFGFGKLDVATAVRVAQGARGAAIDPDRSTAGVSRDAIVPGRESSLVTVVPKDATGLPLGPGRRVTIATTAGHLVGEVTDVGQGRYEQRLEAEAVDRGGVAALTVTVDGVALTAQPRVHLVLDRAEIDEDLTIGSGGCTAQAPR